MKYKDSNVSIGMIPCKKGCQCTDCLRDEIAILKRQINDLTHQVCVGITALVGLQDSRLARDALKEIGEIRIFTGKDK